MEIKLLNKYCAKIKITAPECEQMGISYQSFSPESTSARIFMATILEKLSNEGLESTNAEKLTAEIFEQGDGSLVIYISGKGFRKNNTVKSEEAFIYRTPAELIKAVKNLNCPSCVLYKYNEYYVLICSNTLIKSKYSPIDIAKIKECGTLLSDTPLDLLLDL